MKAAVRLMRAGVILCLTAIFAQAALPLLHGWEVESREAAEHPRVAVTDEGALARTAGEHGGHRHHHAASCSVCRVLSLARHVSGLRAIGSPAPPLEGPVLAASLDTAGGGPDLVRSGPRAPPLLS